MNQKIVIVEDDESILLGLEDALEREGYHLLSASEGEEGFELIRREKPCLALLDVMLPGMSGFVLCKKLRDMGDRTPIIMLTAKSEEEDKVLGLELGADDYLTKPFSIRELVARIKAVRRRNLGAGLGDDGSRQFRFSDIVVDFRRHHVAKGDTPVELTHREFEILSYFINHPGELITRDRLLDEVWGYDVFPTTRTVDNHILRLRKKLEDEPDQPRHILTVRGSGYIFESESKAGQTGDPVEQF